jgi:hypothetical protein
MLGEAFRDRLYGHPDHAQGDQGKPSNRKWYAFSGLFVLLKQKITLPIIEIRHLVDEVLRAFKILIRGYVRTPMLAFLSRLWHKTII